MNRFIATILFAAVLFPGTVWVRPAGASEGGDAAAESYQLETYRVTARKTEEDVQKVPVSTTVVSGTLLEDAEINDTGELTRFAPNVYFKKSTSENVISMRGITSFDTSVFSPTAVYVDDVMLPLHYAHLIDLMDIERVEVLRGPQGTLYGGNSLAGVINIVTRQPGDEKRLRLSTSMGAYTGAEGTPVQYNVGVSAAGPIVEGRWYIGGNGSWEKGDGFITNLARDDDAAGAVDRKNGRVTLRFVPTSRLDLSLTGDLFENDDRISVYRFDSGPYRSDPYTVRHDTDDYQLETGHSQNLRGAYAGERVNFLSVTGLREYSNENLQDYDCTADPMYSWGATLSEYDDRLFSQEFRVSSSDGASPFSWVVGAYGFREKTDISQDNEIVYQNAKTDIDTTGYALFGEGKRTLLNRFHVSAGLRYDLREVAGEKTDIGVAISHEMTFRELLPKLSVGWDLTETAYGYATASKGYLAGGYNYSLATDAASFAYDPEYTWNYETGIKADFLDRRLRVNLALFYIEMTDKQVYEMSSGAYPTTTVDNAAEAHSQGAELEMAFRPARGWDILAGVGYTDATYDHWTATEWNSDYTGLTRTEYDGKNLPNVPEYTGNLGIQYRHAGGLFVRGDLNVVGPLYADHNNNFRESAYSLLNLQLGYEGDGFDVVVWGENVLDTEYHTIAYDWDGEKLVQDGEPALFGVRVTLHR